MMPVIPLPKRFVPLFLFCIAFCIAVLFLPEPLAAQLPQLKEQDCIAALEKIDLIKATDEEIHNAMLACRSLQRSGTEKSIPALEKCLQDSRLTTYARAALQNINSKAAADVLQKYPPKKNNASPVNVKRSELIKKILESKDLNVFVTVLKSNTAGFNAALQAFRQYPDRSIVDVLAKEQKTLKSEQRVAVFYSFCERKDIEPLPKEITEAALSDTNPEVQSAALKVLGTFPNKERIEILFRKCIGVSPDIYETAIDVLAASKYPEIKTVILEKLSDKDVSVRSAAVRLVGERSVKEAENVLWNTAKEKPFGEIQNQAITVLGRIAGKETFEKLCSGYQSAEEDKVRNAYFEGIKTACPLSSDQAFYVSQVSGKIDKEPLLQLELYALIGGQSPLQAIAKAAVAAERDDIIDKATQILGEWTGAEVAPVLLDLSASLQNEKYKIRCLRGLLRAVRQFDMPKEQKRELCEKAFEIAVREDEKKLFRQQLDQLK